MSTLTKQCMFELCFAAVLEVSCREILRDIQMPSLLTLRRCSSDNDNRICCLDSFLGTFAAAGAGAGGVGAAAAGAGFGAG